jgi:hypothetical protein
VSISIVNLFFVVNVIYFDPKLVISLEVILDRNLGYPVGREIVVDDFSLTDLLPFVVHFLEEEKNGVTL